MPDRKIHRRNFLQGLGASISGLWLAGCSALWTKDSSRGPAQEKSDETFDCIVVGAGASGLTLANDLAYPMNPNLKSKKVVILEAADRIGGRVLTDRTHFSRQVERGAEYVHLDYTLAPALWKELKRFSLKLWKISKENGYMYDAGIAPTKGAKSVVREAISWNICKSILAWHSLKMNVNEKDLSAEQFLAARVAPNHDQFELDFKRMILTGHLGALEQDLSMRGFQADKIAEQLSHAPEFYLTSGYDHLTTNLATGVDIRLSKAVKKITYSATGVKVETADGSVYRAKTVVISSSIGVVKSGQIEFSPPLPDEKLAAIDSIKMSYHSKMHIEFTRRFWPSSMSMFHRPDEQRKMGKTYFVPLTDSKGAPPMLTALIMGPDGKRMLNMGDEEVLNNICSDIAPAFPSAGPIMDLVKKNPDGSPSILTTKWNENPLVQGGVSFIRYGSDRIKPEDVRAAYANPSLTPGLFWAGEAAATFTQPASVHGAQSSGARAAIEVQHYLDTNGQFISKKDLSSAYSKTWIEPKATLLSDEQDSPEEQENRLYSEMIEKHHSD